MSRLLIAGNFYDAHLPFQNLFKSVVDVTRTEINYTKSDVVLFGGGSDIWTGFYNQAASRYSGGTVKSRRDMQEENIYSEAIAAGAKLLGICRGAQFLCAMSGGSLIQHVTNHAGSDHSMVTKDGEEYLVCSVHHQMMNPFETEHELIGWAKEKLSTCYLVEKEKDIDMKVEPEVVFFPKTQALCIQYHPEFMPEEHPAVRYAQQLVKEYLLN